MLCYREWYSDQNYYHSGVLLSAHRPTKPMDHVAIVGEGLSAGPPELLRFSNFGQSRRIAMRHSTTYTARHIL